MKPFPPGRKCPLVRILHRATAALLLVAGAPLASAQEAPRAAFTTNPSPAQGEELITVQFLDRSTGTISAWHWDLGDGSTSGEQSPQHTYFGFGNFDVTLTVTGPGGSNSFTQDSAVELLGDTGATLGVGLVSAGFTLKAAGFALLLRPLGGAFQAVHDDWRWMIARIAPAPMITGS